jgi:hypothetical protein
VERPAALVTGHTHLVDDRHVPSAQRLGQHDLRVGVVGGPTAE